MRRDVYKRQALVTNGTEQENGKVYAMHFVYSGNFMAETEPVSYTHLKNSAVGKRISDFYSTLINIRSKMNPFQVGFIYRLQPYGLPDAAGLRVPDKLAG